MVSYLVETIHAVEVAANRTGIVVADADLFGCNLDLDTLAFDHRQQLMTLLVSDLVVFSNHYGQ